MSKYYFDYASSSPPFPEALEEFKRISVEFFGNPSSMHDPGREAKKVLEEMKQRLIKLIETNSEYFVLTGSDSRDLNSCCPSNSVASANRLVEAGVLQVVRVDSNADSCPVNIYAFSGEIQARESKPEFEINPELRQKIKEYICSNQKEKQIFLITLLRWSLLLFVGFSLVVMLVGNSSKQNNGESGFSNIYLVKELPVPIQNGVVILKFRHANRWEFCLTNSLPN